MRADRGGAECPTCGAWSSASCASGAGTADRPVRANRRVGPTAAIASPIRVGNFLRRRQPSPGAAMTRRGSPRSRLPRTRRRSDSPRPTGADDAAGDVPPAVHEATPRRFDLRALRKPSEKLRNRLRQAVDRSTPVRDAARSERRRWLQAGIRRRGAVRSCLSARLGGAAPLAGEPLVTAGGVGTPAQTRGEPAQAGHR